MEISNSSSAALIACSSLSEGGSEGQALCDFPSHISMSSFRSCLGKHLPCPRSHCLQQAHWYSGSESLFAPLPTILMTLGDSAGEECSPVSCPVF